MYTKSQVKVIHCHKLHFLYVSIPKCACTSFKHWIYNIEFGQEFKDYQVNNKWIHIHNCGELDEFQLAQLSEPNQYLKIITIVRDPILRFISAYANRVIHYKELGEEMPYRNNISSLDLKFNPDINYFVQNLETYQDCTDKWLIHHHTRPMTDFIGQDLSLYNHVYRMNEIKKIKSDILQYSFNSSISKSNVPDIPKLQTYGPKLELNVLNPKSFEKLLDYYKQDYKVLTNYYSIEDIKNKYIKSCNQTTG